MKEWMDNFEILESFGHYLDSKEYAPKTYNNYIKPIKSFLKQTQQKMKGGFTQISLKPTKEKYQEIIWLRKHEMDKLNNYEYPSESLRRAVDLFLIQCSTGVRVSDLKNLHFDDQNVYLVAQKTGNTHTIRRFGYFNEIIKRYDGKLPKAISSQKLNPHLKEAAELAGLSRPIPVNSLRYGKGVKPLYEIISSHVGRKSFMMTLFHLDFDFDTISQITNTDLNTVKTFYTRYDNEKALEKMDAAQIQWEGQSPLKVAK